MLQRVGEGGEVMECIMSIHQKCANVHVKAEQRSKMSPFHNSRIPELVSGVF